MKADLAPCGTILGHIQSWSFQISLLSEACAIYRWPFLQPSWQNWLSLSSLRGPGCLLVGRGPRGDSMKTSWVFPSLPSLLFSKQRQTLLKVEKTTSREDNLDTKGLWSIRLYKAVSFHLCSNRESTAQLSANTCMYFHTTPFLVPSHWGKWSFPYFRRWFMCESYCQNCSFLVFCQNLLLKFIVCPETLQQLRRCNSCNSKYVHNTDPLLLCCTRYAISKAASVCHNCIAFNRVQLWDIFLSNIDGLMSFYKWVLKKKT